MHTIIVGAGIAGLWLAEQLAERGDTVTVLEKDKRLGGRVITSAAGYEIGAGRIASTHRRVLDLVRRFGLKTFPHSPGTQWRSLSGEVGENRFSEIWDALLRILRDLDPVTLGSHTLRQLVTNMLGPRLTDQILIQFPYRAEPDTMRADLAIEAFQGDMSAKAQFMGVVGGLSGIIHGMAKAARRAGVRIRLNTEVADVEGDVVVLRNGSRLNADRVVLAVPVTALRRLPCMRGFGLLDRVTMKPLTRFYASTTLRLKERVVTDSPLRYIIPIRDDVIMISYVESQDTEPLRGLTGAALVRRLTKEVRRLFPGTDIAWARAYEWEEGCTYWLPGAYDVVAASAAALQPFAERSLYICGESFSLHQAWMEGALDHAAALLRRLKNTPAN